jgi:AcrR family transcriptional regulator
MNTVSTHRAYTLKARADRQRETRDRIVAATEGLHRELGPARTTIADIARRAGVERLTVYNHFPDLIQLLGACQEHFLTAHPPPNIAPGAITKAQAPARLEAALTDLYSWFRANESMEENVHRDRELVPDLDQLLRKHRDPTFERAAHAYAKLIAHRPSAAATVVVMVRLALDFRTWQLATHGKLFDRDAARLLTRAISAIA